MLLLDYSVEMHQYFKSYWFHSQQSWSSGKSSPIAFHSCCWVNVLICDAAISNFSEDERQRFEDNKQELAGMEEHLSRWKLPNIRLVQIKKVGSGRSR